MAIQERGFIFIKVCLVLYRTENRISFVGQSQDHIRITPAHSAEFLDKTDAIKNMAGVDEESHKRK